MKESTICVPSDGTEAQTTTTVETQHPSTNIATNAMLADSWVCVNQETPPKDVELLAKAPDGTIHKTSWRNAYNIFSCQCKSESAFDWHWKLV